MMLRHILNRHTRGNDQTWQVVAGLDTQCMYCCDVAVACDCSRGSRTSCQCEEASYTFCCGISTPCDCSAPSLKVTV